MTAEKSWKPRFLAAKGRAGHKFPTYEVTSKKQVRCCALSYDFKQIVISRLKSFSQLIICFLPIGGQARYTVCTLTPRKLAASGTVQGCSSLSVGVRVSISTRVFLFMVFLCCRPRTCCHRSGLEAFCAVTRPEPS
jgi:hypothetical protein